MACRLVMDIYPPLVALFPGSHFLPGCSQAIDSQCHDISFPQIGWGPHSQADPCGSASTDNVTGQKRHELAHIADERRYVKNHFGCAASLSELTIRGKPHYQSARIRDFISGCQKRPPAEASAASPSRLFLPLPNVCCDSQLSCFVASLTSKTAARFHPM